MLEQIHTRTLGDWGDAYKAELERESGPRSRNLNLYQRRLAEKKTFYAGKARHVTGGIDQMAVD